MKLHPFLVVPLVVPTVALTIKSRPHSIHPTNALKTMRGDVSPLRFQDMEREREYMSDSVWQEATKSLQIRQFQLQYELQQHQHANNNKFKTISHEWQEQETRRTAPPSEKTLLILGSLLAVNAGFLNGLALLGLLGGGTKLSVAAVTGAWTNTVVGLTSGNWVFFWTQFSVVASYVLGSLVNGAMHPGGLDWTTHSKKRCDSRTLLGVASLVLAAGIFSSLPLLAMAVGMQTSWTSMLLPGGLLRSGHFSGISSDSGTALGRLLRLGRSGMPADQLRKLVIQSRQLASFLVGCALSVAYLNVFGKSRMGLLASVALLIGSFAALNMRHINLKEIFRRKIRPWMVPSPLL